MEITYRWDLRLLSRVIFLVIVGAFIFIIGEPKKRVLVLHSFPPASGWARDVNVGLSRALSNNNGLELRYHYLGLGDNPASEVRLKSFYQARQLIDNFKPELVIAIDDEAQNLLASYYLKSNMKIAFAAVNNNVSDYGYDHAGNVAGIVEEIPMLAMRDAILDSLKQQGGRIIYLSDNSLLSKRDAQRFMEFDWAPLVAVNAVTVDNFEDWKTAFQDINAKADAIVIGYYRRLPVDSSDRTVVDGAEVLAWTAKNTKVPLIGTTRRHVNDGLNFALSASPYEQGEQAGRIGMQMLNGEKIESTVIKPKYFLVHMRQLSGEGPTPLQRSYEAFAMALQKLVK